MTATLRSEAASASSRSGGAPSAHPAIVTGDGCRIAYQLDGDPELPVLMLANSLGATIDMWQPQLAAFGQHFRVLRYDSRGHGASDVPVGSYSIDRLGRDAVELLAALRIPRVNFCGLSMGGMVGQWLAYRAPEHLDRLVLSNTSGFMGPPSDWDARIEAVRAQGMEAIADAVLSRWLTAGFRAAQTKTAAWLRNMLLASPRAGYAGCCSAIRDMDLRLVLPLVRTPTLVIAGRHDPATPLKHAEMIVNAIPDSRLVLLEAAHLSNVEQPVPFANAVLSFLAPSERGGVSSEQSSERRR